ncbi:hypothetical protein [Flavobacterium hibisci]|uniref:hypothetical protein n=1 Tax=Flavobacterium hibisci TaxID=1914462 RepID=UPI001CC0587F|nr:hypothetical protein [Flavobacterium hibisci]MBZ4044509.1 hypothetical protein [Flavobacterium hibisci]
MTNEQHNIALNEFIDKNPRADEMFYIDYQIGVLQDVLQDTIKTADFAEGEYLDGKELINGSLITTRMGTASDYFDFKEWLVFLQKKKEALKDSQREHFNKGLKSAISENKKSGLTSEEQALKMFYEGKTNVTRVNDGNSLYNKFTKWSDRSNRIANDGSDRQLQNKIKRFENVIRVLDDKFKPKAIDELKILKSYLIKY